MRVDFVLAPKCNPSKKRQVIHRTYAYCRETYNDMIKEADSYLYKAKDRGRNQVCAEDENISKQEPSKPPMNIVN